ncbi:MAG TPA: hypothetical protein VFU04_07030 [Solirubrobacterales bacterium]|nr:hypothetical protein [Solirubrobacterales bacterium]
MDAILIANVDHVVSNGLAAFAIDCDEVTYGPLTELAASSALHACLADVGWIDWTAVLLGFGRASFNLRLVDLTAPHHHKVPFAVELLNTPIAEIDNVDIASAVECYSGRRGELANATAGHPGLTDIAVLGKADLELILWD